MTTQVGALPLKHFEGKSNLTPDEASAEDLHLARLLDLMQVHRVPSNIETAQHDPAVDDTWEDWDIITDLNAVLSSSGQIRTGEAVELRGTLELVNGEAGVNNAKYADGGTPDDDDTVRTYATQAAIASEYVHGVVLVTDDAGKIKVESDDVANLGFVFHLTSFQYVHKTATA